MPASAPTHGGPPGPAGAVASGRRGTLGLVAAVLLIAFNLRIAVTSLGALLDHLGDLGLSPTTQGVLTSLPVLCFAAVGATAMALTRRVGVDRGLEAALVLLTAGLVLRVLDGTPALIAGTLIACAGIALANVLIPAIVKEHFPDRVGALTGAYSAVLSIGSAFGAALTVPITNTADNWRVGLGIWAVVALVAAVAWAPYCRGRGRQRTGARGPALWRNPTAWAVTVLFGTQSLCAYVIMSWLPSMYADAGFSDQTAGLLLAVSILVGVPFFFLAPSLAARMRHQGHLVAVLTSLTVLGWLGLWVAPSGGAWLWAALLGAGGAVFPIALSLFSLRTANSAGTAALSTMAQSVGYLLAAGGPFLIGVLHHSTDSWSVPYLMLATLGILQICAGYLAGRPVRIGED